MEIHGNPWKNEEKNAKCRVSRQIPPISSHFWLMFHGFSMFSHGFFMFFHGFRVDPRPEEPRISSDLAATVLAGGQQAITSMGLGLALLLVARRVVRGEASVGDLPLVQGPPRGVLPLIVKGKAIFEGDIKAIRLLCMAL